MPSKRWIPVAARHVKDDGGRRSCSRRVLGHQDVRMLRRYQHVTDSLRQDAADAIDRSFPVNLPVKDVAPGEIPGAT